VAGRVTFNRRAVVGAVMWAILGFAAYSSFVSILQFTGPTQFVWPRYIVDAPAWVGRAVGVSNQPVVNGMVLALGIAIAMMLMSLRGEPKWRKCSAFAIAIACGCGLYLTHTRAAWMSGLAVLVIGAILATGYRRGFVVAIGILTALVAVNWSVFTSSDREAGGIASAGEIDDRLNINQTAIWAATQKPVTGWGLDRFRAVNTYHHQQWAADTPWLNGYGAAAHQNELAILAELGVIGLALWIAVIALVAYRLWVAYRTLPEDGLCGRRLAVTAIMAMAIMIGTGLTVDLRYFDFPLAAVFLICGITIGWSDRYKQGHHG
jgi:O-antigen ligase